MHDVPCPQPLVGATPPSEGALPELDPVEEPEELDPEDEPLDEPEPDTLTMLEPLEPTDPELEFEAEPELLLEPEPPPFEVAPFVWFDPPPLFDEV